MAAPNDQRRGTPSLLSLQPPKSGVIWDQMMAGSGILMPVSQPTENRPELDEEADSFVGQSGPKPPLGSFQPINSAPTPPPLVSSGPLSQLQQPLRPVHTRPTPPPYQPTQQVDRQPSPAVPSASVPPMSNKNYSGHSAPAPPVVVPTAPPAGVLRGPPPTGVANSFRRQGPLQHSFAPTPGLSHPSQSMSPASDPSQPPSYAQLYQVPIYQPPPQTFVDTQGKEPYQTSLDSGMTHAGEVPSSFASSEGSVSPTLALGNVTESLRPVQCHWFYRREVEKKDIWLPFSVIDSLALEEAFKRDDNSAVIRTDGGRYDVTIGERIRRPIYWEEEASPVKRSSWFFKADGQNRFVPYDEDFAEKLEEHYQDAVVNNRLHHRLELPGHESVVVHNAQLVAHYQPSTHTDQWGTVVDGQMRTRVVKRGINEILKVEDGETNRIDHLVFLVHGVGGICDLRFRTLVECVDDFRALSLSLLKTHFKEAMEQGKIGRMEFLPVSWHASLHGDATGIDKRMQTITLPSIPKLRHFTNDTLMDIFFYTSPVYCQTIVDTVGSEVNRLYRTFIERNPNFNGTVSFAGHSLGSLITFDILAHQLNPERPITPVVTQPPPEQEEVETEEPVVDTIESVLQSLGLQDYTERFQQEKVDLDTLKICSDGDLKEMGLPMGSRKKVAAYLKELEEKQLKAQRKQDAELHSQESSSFGLPYSQSNMSLLNRQESVASVNYMVGVAGTGQPSVVYPKLSFQPSCFFAMGSPIAMFLTIRGIQTIGEDYHLPTCPSLFNIFHPFDPVAYRLETLIDPQLDLKPVLVPHHKGRKRMHLELRDSISRMGMDIKQRLIDSLRYTWNSLSEFARAHRSPEQLEAEMDRMVNEEINARSRDMEDTESTVSGADVASQEDIQIGQLNGGRRIDYVLQEKPIESFNEYLFALASHACYWESEDTALMILKEVYRLDGVLPQSPTTAHAPKPTLYNPAGRDLYNPNVATVNPLEHSTIGQNLLYPAATSTMDASQALAPPPLKGFVRVSPMIRR